MFAPSSFGSITVKASSIDRKFNSRNYNGKLCKKLGDFIAGNCPEGLEKLASEPVRTINISEWKKHQDDCANTANKNTDETILFNIL